MSSDDVNDTAPVDAAEKGKAGKKKLVGAAIAALVLILGGGGGYWFMQSRGADEGQENASSAAGAASSSSYIDVPPMVVNLRGGDSQSRFLKLRFIVVAAEGKTDQVRERLPVVLDALQPFLRELRPDDLNGSAAVFRIKEEMMMRATQALGEGMVKDVLIQDLVQQ